jgi:hypothetical protein
MDKFYPPDKRPYVMDIILREKLRVTFVKVTESAYSACLTVSIEDFETAIDIFFPLGTIYVGVERPL